MKVLNEKLEVIVGVLPVVGVAIPEVETVGELVTPISVVFIETISVELPDPSSVEAVTLGTEFDDCALEVDTQAISHRVSTVK